LQNDTFITVKKIDGFVSASILKREVLDGVEFLIVTKWESLDVIKQFAGEQIDKAVVPKLVEDMMIRYDDVVRHYELNFTKMKD
jgi:heme-degrading monooxygenase HmoA